MARPTLRCLAALALAGVAGCIDTDPAVFVEAALVEPQAVVSGGVLGTSLTGSVRLTLHLGLRASGPSEVGVRSLEILSADQKQTVVSPLPLDGSASLPAKVEPGADVEVTLAFDTGASPLPAETQAALCQEGGVRIAGAIEDSLQAGATPVVSGVFRPVGCP